MTIAASKAPKFKAGKALKDVVNALRYNTILEFLSGFQCWHVSPLF